MTTHASGIGLYGHCRMEHCRVSDLRPVGGSENQGAPEKAPRESKETHS